MSSITVILPGNRQLFLAAFAVGSGAAFGVIFAFGIWATVACATLAIAKAFGA